MKAERAATNNLLFRLKIKLKIKTENVKYLTNLQKNMSLLHWLPTWSVQANYTSVQPNPQQGINSRIRINEINSGFISKYAKLLNLNFPFICNTNMKVGAERTANVGLCFLLLDLDRYHLNFLLLLRFKHYLGVKSNSNLADELKYYVWESLKKLSFC